MIAALKQLYERHSNDLAKLKKTYEQHAEECAQVAELTVDPGRREVYLNLAREWTEAAAALQSQTYEVRDDAGEVLGWVSGPNDNGMWVYKVPGCHPGVALTEAAAERACRQFYYLTR